MAIVKCGQLGCLECLFFSCCHHAHANHEGAGRVLIMYPQARSTVNLLGRALLLCCHQARATRECAGKSVLVMLPSACHECAGPCCLCARSNHECHWSVCSHHVAMRACTGTWNLDNSPPQVHWGCHHPRNNQICTGTCANHIAIMTEGVFVSCCHQASATHQCAGKRVLIMVPSWTRQPCMCWNMYSCDVAMHATTCSYHVTIVHQPTMNVLECVLLSCCHHACATHERAERCVLIMLPSCTQQP